jgi:hypothetical protein
MNGHRVFISSFIAALLLLVPLSGAAAQKDEGVRERFAPNRMPALEGQSFAANIDAAGREATAVFNITEGTVSLYLFYPDRNLLRVLYSVPAQTVRSGDTWSINVPTRGVAFTLSRGADERVVVDGRTSTLRFVDRGTIEAVRVQNAPDCAATAMSAVPAEAGAQQAGNQSRLKAKDDSLATCAMAFAFQGCCTSCYCVHRQLDIPQWVDSICCLGSC